MKLFNSQNNIKDSFAYLYQITKEKFHVQKQEIILEYTKDEYESKFKQHKTLNRLDDIDLCIQDFKKDIF